MSSLKTNLESLAASFASEIVRAIQSSSLEDLLGEIGGSSKRPRPAVGRPAAAPAPSGRPAKTTKRGRLKRRSAADIAAELDRVVSLVKSHKTGLRAEQIREQLDMQANEMPRVLKEGLSKRKLKSKGQKRATTYFAA
jgi:hypothetical protein